MNTLTQETRELYDQLGLEVPFATGPRPGAMPDTGAGYQRAAQSGESPFTAAEEADDPGVGAPVAPADTVLFPSGLRLRRVTGATGRNEEHWDPTGSGMPLLATPPSLQGEKISEHFTVRELVSSGGRADPLARISPRLVEVLEAIRARAGKSVRILSGYRSWKRNRQVYDGRGQKPTLSRHCAGQAADIAIPGMTGVQLAKLAIEAGGPVLGLGINKADLHVDVRPTPEIWSYLKDPAAKAAGIAEVKRFRDAVMKGGVPPRAMPQAATRKPAAPQAAMAQAAMPQAAMPQATPAGAPPGPGSGTLVVREHRLLRSHRGTHPDLLLTWNRIAAPGEVDVVVHFHGYSGDRAGMRIDGFKRAISGLDFRTAAGENPRPIIGILPRGHYFGGKSGEGYSFPALTAPGALQALIADALARVGERTGQGVRAGRLILTGHSGGGAPILQVLAHMDPDEIHVFDGTYNEPANLLRWAQRRIQRDAATPGARPPALRVVYRARSPTQGYARIIATAVCKAVADAPAARLRPLFRVDEVPNAFQHNEVGRRFGGLLLLDPAGPLPGASTVACAALGVGSEAEAFGEGESDEGVPESYLDASGEAPSFGAAEAFGEAQSFGAAEAFDEAPCCGHEHGEEAFGEDEFQPEAEAEGEYREGAYQEDETTAEAGEDFFEPAGEGEQDTWFEHGEYTDGGLLREEPEYTDGGLLREEPEYTDGGLLREEPEAVAAPIAEGFAVDGEALPAEAGEGGEGEEWMEAAADEDEALAWLEPGESGETAAGNTGKSLPEVIRGVAEFALGPDLRAGSTGAAVGSLQRALAALGYPLDADDSFGPGTERAVRAFQQAAGLTPNGVVDGHTKLAITLGLGSKASAAPATPAPSMPPSATPAASAPSPLADAIVRIAEQEFQRWRPQGKVLKEADDAAIPILQQYYREAFGRTITAAQLRDPAFRKGRPWSGLFISWVMKQAGAGTQFAYSELHQHYVAAAKRNRLQEKRANPFWAYRPAEVAPQPGDLICWERAGSGATYDNIDGATGRATHSDIVVQVRPGVLRTIGGNVDNTVRDKKVLTQADGRVSLQGEQARIYAVLRCRGAVDAPLSATPVRPATPAQPAQPAAPARPSTPAPAASQLVLPRDAMWPLQVRPEMLEAIRAVRFRNGQEIHDWVQRQAGTDFFSWFNAQHAKRGWWGTMPVRDPKTGVPVKKDGKPRMYRAIHVDGRAATLQAHFLRFWDGIPVMFAPERDIGVLHFLSLMAIAINEVDGDLVSHTEKGSLAYMFNYNRKPGNRLAIELFSDAAFNEAHGGKALGAQLRGNADPVWKGRAWPVGLSSTPSPAGGTPGYVEEADFYKFRGRGVIQTTFREAYRDVLNYITRTYTGSNATLLAYKQRWGGRDPEAVLTQSSNLDWDVIFAQQEMLGVAVYLHARRSGSDYLRLAADAQTLNGEGRGSIFAIGRRISGSTDYGRTFTQRVIQLLEGLLRPVPAHEGYEEVAT